MCLTLGVIVHPPKKQMNLLSTFLLHIEGVWNRAPYRGTCVLCAKDGQEQEQSLVSDFLIDFPKAC